ncbi:DUF6920 family protein [Rhodococcus sp. NPDC003322]
MTEFPSMPRSARAVTRQWQALAQGPSADGTFDPARLDGLPDPVRRWLGRSIADAVPLVKVACFTMRGEIRLGSWRPFTATQILRPGVGFVWAATARMMGLPVAGYDRYADGVGEMRWRLGGVIPVMSESDDRITRSAAGRLAIESVLVPTACLGARWTEDERGAHMTWMTDGHEDTVDVDIDTDGRLRGATMQRWGTPTGADYGRHPFGVAVEEETDHAGITVASRFRAGWWWGTDRQDEGEFFRAQITDVMFR